MHLLVFFDSTSSIDTSSIVTASSFHLNFNNTECFYYLDALTKSLNLEGAKLIVDQFGDLTPIVTLNDIPRQANGYDCGVFVCWYAAMAKQVYESNDTTWIW
ncbi:hypothetical protein P9112_006125 [Eukaryota sp. TZLM1-RC]